MIRIYIRDAKNEAYVSIDADGETDLIICRAGELCRINPLATGHLPAAQRSTSLGLLQKIGKILTDYVAEGRTLWFEPTDERRRNIYIRALKKIGLAITAHSCIVEVTKSSANV